MGWWCDPCFKWASSIAACALAATGSRCCCLLSFHSAPVRPRIRLQLQCTTYRQHVFWHRVDTRRAVCLPPLPPPPSPTPQPTTHSHPPTHTPTCHRPAVGDGAQVATSNPEGGSALPHEQRKQQILKQQRWLLFLRHCAKCPAGVVSQQRRCSEHGGCTSRVLRAVWVCSPGVGLAQHALVLMQPAANMADGGGLFWPRQLDCFGRGSWQYWQTSASHTSSSARRRQCSLLPRLTTHPAECAQSHAPAVPSLQDGEAQCQYGQTCTVAKQLWKHLIGCKDQYCTYPRCVFFKWE